MNYHVFCSVIPGILLAITQGQTREGLGFCFNATLEGKKLSTNFNMKLMFLWCIISQNTRRRRDTL